MGIVHLDFPVANAGGECGRVRARVLKGFQK